MPIIVEFFNSIWYLLISNTATICYILVFVNQVLNLMLWKFTIIKSFFFQLYSASILSLPLPLMVCIFSLKARDHGNMISQILTFTSFHGVQEKLEKNLSVKYGFHKTENPPSSVISYMHDLLLQDL